MLVDGQVVAEMGDVKVKVAFDKPDVTSSLESFDPLGKFTAFVMASKAAEIFMARSLFGEDLSNEMIANLFSDASFRYSPSDEFLNGHSLTSLAEGQLIAKLGVDQMPLTIHFNDEAAIAEFNDAHVVEYAFKIIHRACEEMMDLLRQEDDVPSELHVTCFADGHWHYTNEPMTAEEVESHLEERNSEREGAIDALVDILTGQESPLGSLAAMAAIAGMMDDDDDEFMDLMAMSALSAIMGDDDGEMMVDVPERPFSMEEIDEALSEHEEDSPEYLRVYAEMKCTYCPIHNGCPLPGAVYFREHMMAG